MVVVLEVAQVAKGRILVNVDLVAKVFGTLDSRQEYDWCKDDAAHIVLLTFSNAKQVHHCSQSHATFPAILAGLALRSPALLCSYVGMSTE